MDRRTQLQSMFDVTGFGLEIGPSYNPLLPKAEGFNVETLDHASSEDIRKKYAETPGIDATKIEDVDHVSDGRPMHEVIGEKGRYDFIVASHVIEHTPDMLGFLQDCQALLKPEGVIVLAVPDMRFCFDRYKSATSLGEIIQAHHERRTRHTLTSLFDHIAYFCEMDGAAGWQHGHIGEAALKFSLPDPARFVRNHSDGRYVDSHAWQFTPSSFRLIVEDLHSMGELHFREAAFAGTDIFEVFAVLSAAGLGPGLSRQELLLSSLNESASVAPAFQSMASIVTGKEAAVADTTFSNRRIQELEALVAAEQMRCGVLERRLAAERTDREVLESILSDEQTKRSALEASTSWRITQPLRAAVRTFRG